MPGIEELSSKFKDKGVEFFVVYSKEPHAGERSYFKKYEQHKTYEHKLGYAKELVETFGMKVPVLVDDLDESTVEAYGRMPNMVYIIDKEGKIAYKSDWTEQPRIDLLLEELLAEQGAGVGSGA